MSTTFRLCCLIACCTLASVPAYSQVCTNTPITYSVTLPSGPNVGTVVFTGWSIIQGSGSIGNPGNPETAVTWYSGPGTLEATYNWQDLENLVPPSYTEYVIHYESVQIQEPNIISPPTFDVSGSGSVCAGAPGRTITLSGSDPSYSYQLMRGATIVGSPIPGNWTGGPLTWSNQTVLGTYTVRTVHGTYTCNSEMNGSAILTSTPSPSGYTPFASEPGPYRRVVVSGMGSGNPATHYWQTAPPGTTILNGTSMTYPVSTPLAVTSSAVVYIARYDTEGNCWSHSTGLSVSINQTPPLAEVVQTPSYGYNTIDLNTPDETFVFANAEYYFQTSSSGQVIDPAKRWTAGYKIFGDGTHHVRGRDIVSGTWGPVTTFTVTLKKDYDLNFIASRSFDGSKDEVLTAESKNYFTNKGTSLQSQYHSVATNRYFVAESIEDEYERNIGSFLPAPLAGTDFRYNALFSLTTDGDRFSFLDLNNTSALSTDYPGTVGWYYSTNNSDEPNTPKTTLPYARQTFYLDGFGEVLASARPGMVHRIGSGHESLSGTFPVHSELADYLTRRQTFLAGITQDNDLLHEGVQTISKDENGTYPISGIAGYAISIADKSGKVVMTARPGTAANKVLTVTNTVTANGVPNSTGYNPLVYFYLFTPQTVTISGTGSYTIEDIVTNSVVNPSGQWPAGFYRLKAGVATNVQITYTNYYLDVAYQFYDDAGRLRVSLSPNGYEQLVVKGITDPTKLDKTSYTYNHQGWMLEMTEADAGTTKYAYRKDGKIRFSQNAKQRAAGGQNRFSYTNYDDNGRPTESGEYTPATSATYFDALRFNSVALETIGSGWMEPTGSTSDWIKTHYDLPSDPADHPLFSFPAGYSQKFVRGAVSWTENKNMLTYYCYNEKGQVTWILQRPKPLILLSDTLDLNKSFLLSYQYDPSGSVTEVTYVPVANDGSLIAAERFIHYYEYDASKRLVKTLSGTDGIHKKVRAEYFYYLHGPLKRIELGEHLQGVDFVYNIHGWLTAINNPNTANDPGGDGSAGPHQQFKSDAFGMILDYYESSLGGLFTASLSDSPDLYHHLPAGGGGKSAIASAWAKPANPFAANESVYEIQRTMGMLKENLKSKN